MGHPAADTGKAVRPIEDRFWDKVRKTDTCWQWVGAINSAGYGSFRLSTTVSIQAHRWCYEVYRSPVPIDMVLDHTCRNRSCVNPDHLEVVTNRINVLRGYGACAQNARKTHCPKGHEYTPSNTYSRLLNQRACRECRRASNRERKSRLRAKAV